MDVENEDRGEILPHILEKLIISVVVERISVAC